MENNNNSERQNNSRLALGLSLGLLFGIIFDNLALGLCLGVCLGIVSHRKKEE